MPNEIDLVVRLLAAGGLAAVVGLERELTDQPAGFRTHILVGLGAALFAVLSEFGALASGFPARNVDVTRIAAQIVVGIGFLGAGVIFKSGSNIRGLTTAASLWVTAAIGTAAGMGSLLLAAVTTLIAMVALVGLRPLRRLVRRRTTGKDEIVVEGDRELEVERVLSELATRRVGVDRLTMSAHNGTRLVRMAVRMPAHVQPEGVAQALVDLPSVVNVNWSSK